MFNIGNASKPLTISKLSKLRWTYLVVWVVIEIKETFIYPYIRVFFRVLLTIAARYALAIMRALVLALLTFLPAYLWLCTGTLLQSHKSKVTRRAALLARFVTSAVWVEAIFTRSTLLLSSIVCSNWPDTIHHVTFGWWLLPKWTGNTVEAWCWSVRVFNCDLSWFAGCSSSYRDRGDYCKYDKFNSDIWKWELNLQHKVHIFSPITKHCNRFCNSVEITRVDLK